MTFRSHIDGAVVELTPERAVEVQHLLGSDIAMQLDECVRLPAERADIERAMQLSLRWAERCKRAFEGAPGGQRCSASCKAGTTRRCGAERARAGRDRLPRLRHRRARGRRDAGQMLAMVETAPRCRRPAALSDGRRHAGRSAGSGRARHRYVRLRDADAQRPPRHGLHPVRPDQSSQRPSRRRPASTRRRELMAGIAELFARLSASSGAIRRNARRDAALRDQHRILSEF